MKFEYFWIMLVGKEELIIEMIGCGWSGQSAKELKYSLLYLHFLQSFRIFWIRNISKIQAKLDLIPLPGSKLVCNHGTIILLLLGRGWLRPLKIKIELFTKNFFLLEKKKFLQELRYLRAHWELGVYIWGPYWIYFLLWENKLFFFETSFFFRPRPSQNRPKIQNLTKSC